MHTGKMETLGIDVKAFNYFPDLHPKVPITPFDTILVKILGGSIFQSVSNNCHKHQGSYTSIIISGQ